jgi:peptidyl-prolyl cis-trans isomerase SurA
LRAFRKHSPAVSLQWQGILWLGLVTLATAPLIARAESTGQRAAVLDRVVAVVGEQAILASDVDAEMRFAAFQPEIEPAADNTPERALDRVIDRTLIDEQRALQPGIAAISQKEVEQSIQNLRVTIPACAEFHCKSDAGWNAFLTAHGFTEREVADRLRERLEVLKFVNLRFDVAARVANADVQKYYDGVLRPKLENAKAAVPEFIVVAPRIREILRQQQVSVMLDQWLKSLRGEEHVRILDSAYGDGVTGQ